jgi:hypothetical protein
MARDAGELIDETTDYGTWADWLGRPTTHFSAMFGAIIARGDDYRQTFQHFTPGFDLAVDRVRREQADFPEHFNEHDVYPDPAPAWRSYGNSASWSGSQATRPHKPSACFAG